MAISTIDKLKRARIQIQRSNPFFAYLSLYLKFEEDINNELPDWAGMGVSADGGLLYKKDFVERVCPALDSEELVGVLIHEILHLSLLHLTRRGNRDPNAWNVAADIAVNQIIKENGFRLPEGCLVSDYNNRIDLGSVIINDCNKKTAEEIYGEIPERKRGGGGGKGKGKGGDGGFDYHDEGKKDGKNKHKKGGGGGRPRPLTESEKRELEEYWKGKANEALVNAKLRGNIPVGIERLVGKLSEAKIGWRWLLQKYIQRAIPYDYTYQNPSKKSVSTGIYLPNTTKDCIDVIIGIDTSGSIGDKELGEFLGEMIGMAKAFSSRIKMRVLTHDTQVWDDLVIANGSIDKIKNIKVRGRGGTAHKPLFDYVDDKYKEAKLLICFTDGYSDLEEFRGDKYRFDKVFVISENGDGMQLKKWRAEVLKLKDYKDS